MKTDLPRVAFGGIDRSLPPHLIEDTRWVDVFNLRPFRGRLTQVPLKRKVFRKSTNPIQIIATMATGTRNEGLHFGLSSDLAFQIQPAGAVSIGAPVFTTIAGRYYRWAHCMYNRQMWFTNPLNSLKYTDGASVKAYNTTCPAGYHIEAFYDHLCIGNYSYKGDIRQNGVIFSGLFNPSDWNTLDSNEVARLDFEEFARHDYPLMGLTGLKRMNNTLCAYLPTAVIGVQYLGKANAPGVYKWDAITEDRGNTLMYGLARHSNTHFFFDGIEVEFYQFSGAGFEPIGMKVAEYFVNDVNTDFELLQRTYAYTLPEFQEVWWVYVSKASDGEFDHAVVYNWRTKEWFTASVEDVHCVGGVTKRAKTCDELTGTADALGATEADDLSLTTEAMLPRYFGAGDGNVLREEVSADGLGDLMAQELPFLVTKDVIYGDYNAIKEVDAVKIDATFQGACDGLDVFVAARDEINQEVQFNKVGTWKPGSDELRLTFPGVAGRIFRWKFVPMGGPVRNLKVSVIVDSVYDGKAQK